MSIDLYKSISQCDYFRNEPIKQRLTERQKRQIVKKQYTDVQHTTIQRTDEHKSNMPTIS